MHGTGKERLESTGSQRLVDFAKTGEVLDERLYMPIAAATGGAGNTTALVGTAEQVADSLMKYYELGCTTLLIRGFDAYNDAVYWGKELIPLLKESVERYHKIHSVTGKHLL
jgi:alkanesulfonate monooxygenase